MLWHRMQTIRMQSGLVSRELQMACPMELLDKDVGRILTTSTLYDITELNDTYKTSFL